MALNSYDKNSTTGEKLLDNGGLFGLIDDWFGWAMFGDPSASSEFYNDITGYNAQQREFGQQEKLLHEQQEFERQKVVRYKEMGLNPYLAAEGASNPSAPAVPSASSAPAAGFGSAASALGAVGSVAQSFADAHFKNITADPTAKKLFADTEKSFAEAGFSEEQTKFYSIGNMFLPTEKALGIQALRKNLNMMDVQRDLYVAQKDHYRSLISLVDQQIEESKASISLMDMQRLTEQKRGLLLDQQTFEVQFQNNLRQMFKIDPLSPIENNLFLLWLQNDPLFETGCDLFSKLQYKKFAGQYKAESEYIYEIQKGKSSAEALFGQVNTSWAAAQQAVLQAVETALQTGGSEEAKKVLIEKSVEQLNNANSVLEARIWWTRYAEELQSKYDSGDISVKDALDEANRLANASSSELKERYNIK